jgi:hypothetical protein
MISAIRSAADSADDGTFFGGVRSSLNSVDIAEVFLDDDKDRTSVSSAIKEDISNSRSLGNSKIILLLVSGEIPDLIVAAISYSLLFLASKKGLIFSP